MKDPREFRPLPELKASCCQPQETEASTAKGAASACCAGGKKSRPDYLLWVMLVLAVLGLSWHLSGAQGPAKLDRWSMHFSEVSGKLIWGVVAGVLSVAALSWIPRDWVQGLLGAGGTWKGIVRATFAGVVFDLCNHGILLIAAQLYRKGVSYGQVVAFLIASPWNSFSLTLILALLIGWKWTLIFIGLSVVIALITGKIIDSLVASGRLAGSPYPPSATAQCPTWQQVKIEWKKMTSQPAWAWQCLKNGIRDSRSTLRWLLLGGVLTATIQTWVSTEHWQHWFGPSLLGLAFTLVATSLLEVCSEASSPVAADLMHRAQAPGNAFAFLMAGAATDYTEIMVLKDTTKSWKSALALPLVSVPQVLILAYLLNQ